MVNTCEYGYVSYPYSVTHERGGLTREAKIFGAVGQAVASVWPLGAEGAQLEVREGGWRGRHAGNLKKKEKNVSTMTFLYCLDVGTEVKRIIT